MIMRRAFLTFGQLYLWRSLEALAESERAADVIVRQWPVPPETTVGAAMAALRALGRRHDALRSRLELDHDDEPRQVLDGASLADCEYVEADGYADEPARIDLEHGPLWTARVLGRGDRAVSVRVAAHYLIANASAMDTLREDFHVLLAGRDLPPAASPFDLADEQRSPGWARRRAAAVDQWRGVAAATRADQADQADRADQAARAARAAVSGAEPRWARLVSAPALAAAHRTAARTHTSVPSVVLTALCRRLAETGTGDAFAVALLVGNRTSPRWRSLVCTLDQITPIRYEHRAGEPFDQTAARVHRAALVAYSRGCYSVDEATAAVAEHGWADLEAGVAAYSSWVGPVGEVGEAGEAGAAGWRIELIDVARDNEVGCYLRGSADEEGLRLRLERRRPTAAQGGIRNELAALHAGLIGAGVAEAR